MKTATEQTATNANSAPDTNRSFHQDEDEAEIARRIDRAINKAESSLVEKLEDGTTAAKRFLKHGREALEDRMGELSYKLKKHPIGLLGMAFAVGGVLGLLLARSSENSSKD